MATNKLNFVSQFLCKLLGLNSDALYYCQPQTRKAYLNQGLALFFVSLLAIATGIELGLNFSSNPYVVGSTGILLSFLVFAMDYFLLSVMKINVVGVVSRLLFSITIVLVSSTSILLLINERDI